MMLLRNQGKPPLAVHMGKHPKTKEKSEELARQANWLKKEFSPSLEERRNKRITVLQVHHHHIG